MSYSTAMFMVYLLLSIFASNSTGVHLGQSGQLNHAISFESPEIRAFLKEHIIVTYPVDSGFLEIRAGPLNM